MLLDLRMPDLDGMGVLEQLRKRGNDVPVVMVTAHGTIPDVVAAMRLGAIDFVSKPLTPEALRGVVADVLHRHDALRPSPPPAREPVTAASQFALDPRTGQAALLNLCAFDEAEVYLKQAIALEPKSAEAHNLMGVVNECRNRHDDAYRSYRPTRSRPTDITRPAKHNMARYYERFTFGRSDLELDTGAEADPGGVDGRGARPRTHPG